MAAWRRRTVGVGSGGVYTIGPGVAWRRSAARWVEDAVVAVAAVTAVAAKDLQVLGVGIDRLTLQQAVARLEACVESGRPHQVVTVNLDFLRLAQRDRAFQAVLNAAALAVADGAPLVWASRLLGRSLPERVAGVDLVEEAAALAARRGWSLYLLGAAPGVAAAAAAALQQRHAGLQIAGTYSPPFGALSADEEAKMVNAIVAAQPAFLFVAFGAPRQDRWIHEHLQTLGVPVCMGVGGTFDIIAGRIPRAPGWMQRAGLEWLYRLRQEPQRLWRRYLLNDLPVFARLLWQSRPRVQGPRYDPDALSH